MLPSAAMTRTSRDANAVIDSDLVPTLLLARVEPGECHV